MVAHDLAARDIHDERVLAAMESVPRERFVPEDLADAAYEDRPLPIGVGQTISQPYIVALMAQEARIRAADRVLEVGTGSGYGAAVLGRKDIGSLEVGKCADFFAVNLNRLEYAGAWQDPLAAVVFCAPVKADWTVVGGQAVVKSGELVGLDLPRHIEKHNAASRKMIFG